MTNSEKLLHLSAKIDQIYRELDPIWRDKSISLSACHEVGIIMSYCSMTARKLNTLAARLEKKELT